MDRLLLTIGIVGPVLSLIGTFINSIRHKGNKPQAYRYNHNLIGIIKSYLVHS